MSEATLSSTPTADDRSPRPVGLERLSYTLRDGAAVTGLSIATLRRHNKSGRLRFIKIGGRTLIDARSLHALVA